MGLFRGIKKAWGGITGQTAAREARRAGRREATAIERGLAAQQRVVPAALEDVVRGAREAGLEYRPYAAVGPQAAAEMQQLLRTPALGYTPAEYRAPTAEEVAASPAVRFRMQEAQRALETGAAARGRLLGGGAQRELARYMQGLASQEYGAEEERRFRQAQFAEEQARFAPQFAQQQRAQRLAGLQYLGGMGFEAAGQRAGLRERLGQIMSGIRTGSGAAQAAAMQAAGQARASGALAGVAARQQAMGNLMRLGGMAAGSAGGFGGMG